MERHPKHWVLPECRGRKHQTHPQAPFSSISFPARGKRYGRRRRVRTGLDGTSPRYSRSLFSSEPVSSFPNRKLNLRFGFYGKSATASQSRLRRASIPTLFVPSGHFPLIGGIGPWKGSQGLCAPSKPSPMRGRWHGEAVTDEVGAVSFTRHCPPHQSPPATAGFPSCGGSPGSVPGGTIRWTFRQFSGKMKVRARERPYFRL